MALSKAAWAEIRRAYEAGVETVAAISARYGISQGAIYGRSRLEGWAKRSAIKKARPGSGSHRRTGAAANKQEAERKRRCPERDGQLIMRLYNAIDSKLKRLEARMQTDQEITAADSERETRELGLMIRSFEKVTAFATELEGQRGEPHGKSKGASGDAERLREEIAERLERLSQDRDATGVAGVAE